VLAAQQRQCVRKLREHAGRARARARARAWSGPGEQAEARLELSGGSQHGFASSMLRPPTLRDAQGLGEELLPVRGRLHQLLEAAGSQPTQRGGVILGVARSLRARVRGRGGVWI
jgi:hypothetical protein